MLNPFSFIVLLNKLVVRGFKLKLFYVIWLVFIELKFRLFKNPLAMLSSMLFYYLPWFRLSSKHLAGKKYLIPIKISFQKSTCDFWKLIVKSAKQRLETTFYLRVFGEILDTYNNKSATIRLLQERHKLIYENRQNYRLLFI